MRTFFIAILLFVTCLPGAWSQERNWTLNGYVKDMHSFYFFGYEDIPDMNYNMVHNRLNFKWFTSDKITVVAELRNRLIIGNILEDPYGYIFRQYINTDNGYVDLGGIVAEGDQWLLHSMIDRIYIDYSGSNWQLRIGRQRVNWGMNLVWNPNDVFNSFSYFDFDYEERPGTDAVKFTFYPGTVSSGEIVYQFGDNADEMALAGRYRTTVNNYDIQFLGGWVGKDLVIGTGWAGDIKGAGFRGEVTFFEPRNSVVDSESAVVASLSADYAFRNSLYLHSGVLFNSTGESGKAAGINLFSDQDLSPKMLSIARYSLFFQSTYRFTPLLNGGVSSIINPNDGSWFMNPSLTCSITNNIDFYFSGQLFFGDEGTEFGDVGKALYARVKWSF